MCQFMIKETKRRFAHVIDFNSEHFDPCYVVATFLDPNCSYFIDNYDLGRVVGFTVDLV